MEKASLKIKWFKERSNDRELDGGNINVYQRSPSPSLLHVAHRVNGVKLKWQYLANE